MTSSVSAEHIARHGGICDIDEPVVQARTQPEIIGLKAVPRELNLTKTSSQLSLSSPQVLYLTWS